MPPTQASAKFASASSASSSVSAQQVQKRATAPRPTGKTVVRASAARAAGRAAAAAATRSATSARADSDDDDDDDDSAVFVDPRERKALALLQGLAAAIGGIAQADPAVAAAVQLPRGVTLLDVAVAVDAAVERADSSCYSPNSPEAPSSPDYAPAYTDYYYHCAYEYRPDCTCKGCVAARPPSNSPRYAPSSPDIHDCDNADCPCVGCAAVRAAHSPRYTPTAPLGDCDSPCYAPTSPNWYVIL